MTRDELKEILPHRAPMLLLDEAEIDQSGRAMGKYTITGKEYFLQGHFPGNPVVPGVILCEMMAQTCGVLLAGKTSEKTPYYTGLDKVKFRSQVRTGDEVKFICEILKSKGPFIFAKGKGYVKDALCIEGEFSFALI